jgi:hypothetical protein
MRELDRLCFQEENYFAKADRQKMRKVFTWKAAFSSLAGECPLASNLDWRNEHEASQLWVGICGHEVG